MAVRDEDEIKEHYIGMQVCDDILFVSNSPFNQALEIDESIVCST